MAGLARAEREGRHGSETRWEKMKREYIDEMAGSSFRGKDRTLGVEEAGGNVPRSNPRSTGCHWRSL